MTDMKDDPLSPESRAKLEAGLESAAHGEIKPFDELAESKRAYTELLRHIEGLGVVKQIEFAPMCEVVLYDDGHMLIGDEYENVVLSPDAWIGLGLALWKLAGTAPLLQHLHEATPEKIRMLNELANSETLLSAEEQKQIYEAMHPELAKPNPHIGSSLESFFRETGEWEEIQSRVELRHEAGALCVEAGLTQQQSHDLAECLSGIAGRPPNLEKLLTEWGVAHSGAFWVVRLRQIEFLLRDDT